MSAPRESDHPLQPAERKQTTSPSSKSLQPGEFRVTCGHCAKSIRVPLKMVGQAGACPKCNYVFVIPPPGQQPLVIKMNERFVIDEPIVLDGDVFADDAVKIDEPIVLDEQPMLMDDPFLVTSFPTTPTHVPVVSPPAYQQPTPQYSPLGPMYGTAAQVHLPLRKSSATPASIVTTKVCGVLLVIAASLNALGIIFGMILRLMPSKPVTSVRGMDLDKFFKSDTADSFMILFSLVGFVIACVLIFTMAYGGAQMFRFRQWPMALAASISALFPISCFGYLAIPLGIVSIVLLCQTNVKAAFE